MKHTTDADTTYTINPNFPDSEFHAADDWQDNGAALMVQCTACGAWKAWDTVTGIGGEIYCNDSCL